MPKTKLIIGACFGTFALIALSTATAAVAAEWDVNGRPLVGTKLIASHAKVLEHETIFVKTGLNLRVECVSAELDVNGGELVAADELRIKSLAFKECSAGEVCEVQNHVILTLALRGLAELNGTLSTIIQILPLTSKIVATYTLEGELCAMKGVHVFTGSFYIPIPDGHDPAVLHRELLLSLAGSLKEGSFEVPLARFALDMQLASGESWNFL